MPRIPSANPDFDANPVLPTNDPVYRHGMDERQQFIPMAFQITSPFDSMRCLMPHALVLHVNPSTINESKNKRIERFQTRGGWVEQHWQDELDEISCDGSTGAFMNVLTGLASILRQRTIAWDRFRDLYDLYRNNGSVYDPYGNIVLQGDVMLMYDRGTYIGYFKQFDFEETDDSPFAFKMSWTFKVTQTLLKLPVTSAQPTPSPAFQSRNTLSPGADLGQRFGGPQTTTTGTGLPNGVPTPGRG